MKITPYKSLGDFNFDDGFEDTKSKLGEYKRVEYSESVEMGKRYPSIYIHDIDLLIVFTISGDRVRHFETEGEIYHQDLSLQNGVDSLFKHYSKHDPDIKKDDNGFDTPSFGFSVGVSEDHPKRNTVLVYSKDYKKEPPITKEDILKHYLGEGNY